MFILKTFLKHARHDEGGGDVTHGCTLVQVQGGLQLPTSHALSSKGDLGVYLPMSFPPGMKIGPQQFRFYFQAQ